jgi:hypothetical protein
MVTSVNKINVNFDKYDTIDSSLIASRDYIRQFGLKEDYVEYHVYTKNGSLLYSNYNYTEYRVPGTLQGSDTTYTQELEFFPGNVVEGLGFTYGTYNVQFNVYRKKIVDINQKVFFIKEISNDRKELRISSNDLSNLTLEEGVVNFLYEIQSSSYFKDFLLNFGDNKIINAVNIALDKNTDPYSILIKLYQPLPNEFDLKASFWFVEELSEAAVYEVNLAPQPVQVQTPFLRAANFDIEVDENSIKPSDYLNINELLSNKSIGAYQELLNELNKKGIQINVDYSDYSNFVHFSSARERLLNFRYKVDLIENYQRDIDAIKTTTDYNTAFNSSGSIASLQGKINNLVTNFDGYETYLYYTSESSAWPKSNSNKPYTLYSSTSSAVQQWLGSYDYDSPVYGGQLYTASVYDLENQDNLTYIVPEYIAIDPVNDGYTLFLTMVGQHFDNVWIYMKSITDLYKNNNNLNKGISKDLVYYALRSLGIKLYNSKSSENLFQYLIGSSQSGSYSPTGSSFDTVISASAYTVPGQDIQKETLKRIYHNLPLLLKSKGTERGLKALISSFGIPDTILSVNEFGGADKLNNTVEYTYNRFSYALNMSGSYVKAYWGAKYDYPTGSVTNYVPNSVEFRFNPDKDYYYYTSSLFDVTLDSGGRRTIYADISPDSSSGYPYSVVSLYLSGSAGVSRAYVSLPIFMTASSGESLWWNVMVKRRNVYDVNTNNQNQYYDLYVKNKIGLRIGHEASASIFATGAASSSYNYSWNRVSQSLYLGGTGSKFVGTLQELRYWTTPLSESVFDYHTLNPDSIRGNYSGSSYNELSARFSLGNNLYKYNHTLTGSVYSVQPNYKERSIIAGATIKSASFVGFPNEVNYSPNDEEYVTDSPNMVYSNPVNQKVRIVDNVITGSVLSPFIRFEDETQVYTTKDVHYIDASFSPSNELNKDIIGQYGSSIDIDQYIGDPRDDYKKEYPNLVAFNKEYYDKYFIDYNLADYIRLIKFFDNSLFKMIKDYVPARSSIQTGLTIKSTIIERPKSKKTQATVTENYNYKEGKIVAGDITANSIYTSSYGDGSDFYTGQLSGSLIDINNIFDKKNYNPYLLFTASIDHNFFDRSVYNTTINNVSASQVSKLFKRINPYQFGVLEPVQISDSNYSDPRYTRPRYDGSKTISSKYNFYTKGDISYGKTAAIDFNTEKFAFANSINKKNLNFYDKTTVNIKYLIDATGSITELSRKNYHLFEVQNIYKKGDLVNVSLMDKLNPTNQASLDGDKVIWEGGFSYSPIIFREINENLNFTYIEPTDTTEKKLGLKAINISGYTFQTIGDAAGALPGDFTTTNVVNPKVIFKINGVADNIKSFSQKRIQSNNWPYLKMPLTDYDKVVYKDYKNSNVYIEYSNPYEDQASYYSLDWFIPGSTSEADGGYRTDDFAGKLTVVQSGTEYYSYVTAPRTSTYKVNVDLPIRTKARNPETAGENRSEKGPSIVKIIGVLEVQKVGSSTWEYLDTTDPANPTPYGYTKFTATNIPIANGGSSRWDTTVAAVNENYSFIKFSGDAQGGTYNGRTISPYFEGRCQLFGKEIALDQNDKLRIRFYFAEITTFFRRSEDIYFEIQSGDTSKAFFEVWDKITSNTTQVTTTTIGTNPLNPIIEPAPDNKTIIFSDEASLLWNRAYFEPPDSSNPASISNSYSSVEYPFSIEVYDVIRFTQFNAIKPDYYLVMEVIEPQIQTTSTGTITTYIVTRPASIVLDRAYNPNQITGASFAILRKVEDETVIILDFKKKDGLPSNAFMIPYNIKDEIKKNIGNIVAPLKDTILSKVLIIG